MPKISPPETPTMSALSVDIEFTDTDGEVVDEKVHHLIPNPGDEVMLGSKGSYTAIRVKWEYTDGSNEPWVKVMVRKRGDGGVF